MSGLSSLSMVVSFFAVIAFVVIALKNRKVNRAVYKKGMRYAGISFVIMIVSSFGVEEVEETTTESNQEIQGNVAQSNMEVEEAKAEAEAEAKAKADEEARLKVEAEAAAEKAQAEAEAEAAAEAEAVAKAEAEEQAEAQVAQQQQASAAPESFQNCTEMRIVYPSGVESSHPAYSSKHDRDKDGWACE